MKKILSTAALIAATTCSASAADLAPRPYVKAPIAATVYDWTGFYAGVNIGGVASGGSVNDSSDPSIGGPFTRAGQNDLFKAGVIGGGQIGYNWQVAPSWVVGVEGDISGLNVKRSTCDIDDCQSDHPLIFSTRTDWLATVRARVGYTWDRSLLYVTGGGAFAGVKDSFIEFGEDTVAHNATKSGYAVGAGIETALWANWSVKAEYLYADVGTNRVDSVLFSGAYLDFKHEYQIARIGLNYRFGDPVAPAASISPLYTKAPVASAAVNWTGLYAGVNVGGVASGGSVKDSLDPALGNPNSGDQNDLFKAGVIGGGQVGYNWQLAPSWVVGLEGDISGLNAKRSTCDINDCQTNDPLIFSTRTDWLATVRGRVGYAWDRSLLYVTGGAAFAGVKDSINEYADGTDVHNATKSGYAVGAGLETALWANWSVKAEYLYANVGTNRVDSVSESGAYLDLKHEYQIGRIGLNYRFGGPVANY
jgi:outer membrane immunogenic protein